MLEAFVGGLTIGVWTGYLLHYWQMRHWRKMYSAGEAECWRCHGSGKERNS